MGLRPRSSQFRSAMTGADPTVGSVDRVSGPPGDRVDAVGRDRRDHISTRPRVLDALDGEHGGGGDDDETAHEQLGVGDREGRKRWAARGPDSGRGASPRADCTVTSKLACGGVGAGVDRRLSGELPRTDRERRRREDRRRRVGRERDMRASTPPRSRSFCGAMFTCARFACPPTDVTYASTAARAGTAGGTGEAAGTPGTTSNVKPFAEPASSASSCTCTTSRSIRDDPAPGAAANVAVSAASETQSTEPAPAPSGTTNDPGAMFAAPGGDRDGHASEAPRYRPRRRDQLSVELRGIGGELLPQRGFGHRTSSLSSRRSTALSTCPRP